MSSYTPEQAEVAIRALEEVEKLLGLIGDIVNDHSAKCLDSAGPECAIDCIFGLANGGWARVNGALATIRAGAGTAARPLCALCAKKRHAETTEGIDLEPCAECGFRTRGRAAARPGETKARKFVRCKAPGMGPACDESDEGRPDCTLVGECKWAGEAKATGEAWTCRCGARSGGQYATCWSCKEPRPSSTRPGTEPVR